MRGVRFVAFFVLGFTLISSAHAGTLAPKRPSNVAMLKGQGAACTFGTSSGFLVDRRSEKDGSTSSGYTIPPGMVLILDGLSWSAAGTQACQLGIDGGDDVMWETTGSNGQAIPLPGIVVQSGSSVCMTSSCGSSFLHGYTVKDNY